MSGPVLVVTGASGYLGHRLVPIAAARAAVVGVARRGSVPSPARPLWLDLTDRRAATEALTTLRPDAVVHAAAANPGASPEELWPANVGGSEAVAHAVAELGGRCHLVHVSTDVVHDGRAAPYADDAEPNPLSPYAAAKAEAERRVRAACPGAAVVRTSLIYGLRHVDRTSRGFLERLARGERVELFADVIRQPIWADSLADALVRLALDHRDVAGSINVAGREALRRSDYHRRLLRWWGVDPGSDTIDVSAAGLANVPLDLRLRLDRAGALGLELPGVSETLARHRRPGDHPG